MHRIPLKKNVIYLQIILFILGSFTLLAENALASSSHMFSSHTHENESHNSMHTQAQSDHAHSEEHQHPQTNGSDQCCDDCNCSLDCSIIHFVAASMSPLEQLFLHSSMPVVPVSPLLGIYHLPERPPPGVFFT